MEVTGGLGPTRAGLEVELRVLAAFGTGEKPEMCCTICYAMLIMCSCYAQLGYASIWSSSCRWWKKGKRKYIV